MNATRMAACSVMGFALIGFTTSFGLAAATPELKASRACRKTIASSFSKAALTSLGVIGGCHKSRDKGTFAGDCNDLAQSDLNAKVAAAETKATSSIAKKCLTGEPVLRNYDQNDPATVFLPTARTTLETSGTALLGTPQLVGDKAKVKCHAAIAKAVSSDIAEILKAATKCQNGEDKLADTFGALDCVATAAKAGPKGEAAIAKSCNDQGIAGADVGSCDPLPTCATQAATASGQGLAAAIYGQPRTTCQAGDQVHVVASLDKTYGGAAITLAYSGAVNIPGSGAATAVTDRVVFANGGLPTVSDDDAVGDDGIDDTLTAGLLGFGDNAPGTFVTVTFDCIPGQQFPVASAFVCTVSSASTSGGDPILDEQCAVEVH